MANQIRHIENPRDFVITMTRADYDDEIRKAVNYGAEIGKTMNIDNPGVDCADCGFFHNAEFCPVCNSNKGREF